MLIDIRTSGFSLTEAIWMHVEARVESALGPFSRHVRKVAVHLEDVNADRGGIDKRCHIVVTLRRHPVQVAEATDADLYTAVDQAAERIRSCVLRTVKQQITLDRRGLMRAGVNAGMV